MEQKMDLPKTTAYAYLKEKLDVAKRAVVITDGRVHNVIPERNGHKDYYNWHRRAFGIEKGPTLVDLEKHYLQENFNKIDSYIKSSLDEIVSEKEREVLEKQESLLRMGDNFFFAKKVIEEIIPNYDPEKKKSSDRKDESVSSDHRNRMIEESISRREGGNNHLKMLSNKPAILESLDENFLLMRGMKFPLEAGDTTHKKNNFLYINNRIYNVEEGSPFDLEVFEREYRGRIKENIKKNLMNKDSSFSRELEDIAKQEEILDILNRKEYIHPEKKVGFKVADDKFYVCTLVDKSYIFYDPRGDKYYGFGPDFGKDPAIIGIPVKKEGQNIKIDTPLLVNGMKHPSVQNSSDYKPICTGSYEENKGNPGRNGRPTSCTSESFSYTIQCIMGFVINTFTMGYSGGPEWRSFHQDENFWKDHLLRPEQVDRGKISNNSFLKY
ncbi:MAG: hypothetical protein R6U32_05305 [Candidatus Woesearchaeota archaeon]